ncbi:phosphate ABC transporter substrate-binding protein PstS [Solihabitans fulvus]|uniref:Phosphate ABC transporter substrate-binding protein PstS n=2 Tax=Solihabitans fulvus TaxID=1892852 RepID=A0A5B2WY89_9PSEU|nr:phosphate ABC transporter substrate-binding protein PstS [Solihabitans fulvus]
MFGAVSPASADAYYPIAGSGSTWSANAISQWISDAKTFGLPVSYTSNGSSAGRLDFANKLNDFGVSEIPYQGTDPLTGNADNSHGRPFAYMPIVAGGTSFMYHLTVGGQLLRDLRLSGQTITKIFTGQITDWSDDAITADNNGRKLPKKKIVPVVRSDGSGTSAQFSLWMSKQYKDIWCPFFDAKVAPGKPCGLTSNYPTFSGDTVAQGSSVQMAGYISAEYAEGAIGYVEYSYARSKNFPVAKMLNASGYFVEPTDYNVAVALTQAQINQQKDSDLYLTQVLDGVYSNQDPRTYPLSSYSYMILPTSLDQRITADKGRSLGAFAHYFLCQGQRKAGPLGYSPLPLNLVQAGFDQVAKVPGAEQQQLNPSGCDNPTFDPADPGSNRLAKTAPMPPACDHTGQGPCAGGGTGDGSAGNTGTGTGQGTGQGGNAGQGTGSDGNSGQQGQNGTGTGAVDPVTGQTVDPATGEAVDPATGQVIGSTRKGGSGAVGSATELAALRSESTDTTLGVLAAVELVLVLVVPAFVARQIGRRRGRRAAEGNGE